MVSIGYVRRSKESTARTVSLEEQRARIETYCREQGWTLAEVIVDDGVSGGKRGRLVRLAEVVRRHRAGAVVAYHLDRLSRDVAALLDTIRDFDRRGVELHLATRGRIETRTASGFLLTGVEGLMAEHYRRVVSEKTRDALARLRLTGRQYSHLAPYGYRAEAGRLERDLAEQRQLATMRTLLETGLSLRALAGELATRGLTQRNGRPWSPQLIHRVIRRQPIGRSVDADADLVAVSA